MPDHTLLMYSLVDLGITAGNYDFANLATGGTFTASATAAPTSVTVTDTDTEDTIFNDGLPGDAGATPTQILNGTVDGTVFNNVTTNPENAWQVFDSSGAAVGFILDLHDDNASAFASLQGYITTFAILPGETYTVNLVSSIPNANYNIFLTCFVLGTMIDTKGGPTKIEDLAVGDLIKTRDHGLQPIQWINRTAVAGTGAFSPIRISKGALGNTADLWVSPQHRMLLTGWQAELLFGEAEVLVCAKHLINGDTIFADPRANVIYFHMMFDQHQIVTAAGCHSESFYPGPVSLGAVEDDVREEILTLFPELRDDPGCYGPHARTLLKGVEGQLLAHYV